MPTSLAVAIRRGYRHRTGARIQRRPLLDRRRKRGLPGGRWRGRPRGRRNCRGNGGRGHPRRTADLARNWRGAEDRVRRAIAAANNRIYEIAQQSERSARHGLRADAGGGGCERGVDRACGRLAALPDLERLRSASSPPIIRRWAKSEDAGDLTEDQAMLHPRRNEVFRDVGTRPHKAGDEGFIEIRRCHFKPEAAFLLCSDGLSDPLPVGRHPGHRGALPGRSHAKWLATWWRLPMCAGGSDNITALFVAGSGFRGRGTGYARAACDHSHARRCPLSRPASDSSADESRFCSMACCWACCWRPRCMR